MADEEPGIIGYAGTGVKEGRTDRGVVPWAVLLLVITGVAAMTCVRIEISNARIGFYMPRDFSVEGGTWRNRARMTEARWRLDKRLETGDETWMTRALTPADKAEWDRAILKVKRHDELQGVVASWGLLQYPLVLGLLVGNLWVAFLFRGRWWRVVMVVAWVVAAGCGVMMVYRGYFTSLGW